MASVVYQGEKLGNSRKYEQLWRLAGARIHWVRFQWLHIFYVQSEEQGILHHLIGLAMLNSFMTQWIALQSYQTHTGAGCCLLNESGHSVYLCTQLSTQGSKVLTLISVEVSNCWWLQSGAAIRIWEVNQSGWSCLDNTLRIIFQLEEFPSILKDLHYLGKRHTLVEDETHWKVFCVIRNSKPTFEQRKFSLLPATGCGPLLILQVVGQGAPAAQT